MLNSLLSDKNSKQCLKNMEFWTPLLFYIKQRMNSAVLKMLNYTNFLGQF